MDLCTSKISRESGGGWEEKQTHQLLHHARPVVGSGSLRRHRLLLQQRRPFLLGLVCQPTQHVRPLVDNRRRFLLISLLRLLSSLLPLLSSLLGLLQCLFVRKTVLPARTTVALATHARTCSHAHPLPRRAPRVLPVRPHTTPPTQGTYTRRAAGGDASKRSFARAYAHTSA